MALILATSYRRSSRNYLLYFKSHLHFLLIYGSGGEVSGKDSIYKQRVS